MKARVAVAGAGIYGATAALELANAGHDVQLFDPLGMMRAASVINQYRIHAGYHYPRSPETIAEILECRDEFMQTFPEAVVGGSSHYYAIPREGSLTTPDRYEQVMREHGLGLRPCRPDWMDYDFIDRCYEVDEHVYDPDLLRDLVIQRVEQAPSLTFEPRAFTPEMREDFDVVVWATYGMGPSKRVFPIAKYQVAEKILIRLPERLHGIALVVVDGPFTAFDPYGGSSSSLFGSARHTNHWTSTNSAEPVPTAYARLLNRADFEHVPTTHFDAMRRDCALAVPAAAEAVYLGSRFTLRVVEDDPRDRRLLRVEEAAPGEFHVFSGKVVGAVKAARLLRERIAARA